jgi:hypothetical protein
MPLTEDKLIKVQILCDKGLFIRYNCALFFGLPQQKIYL